MSSEKQIKALEACKAMPEWSQLPGSVQSVLEVAFVDDEYGAASVAELLDECMRLKLAGPLESVGGYSWRVKSDPVTRKIIRAFWQNVLEKE